jgi:hypothetical protein
MHLLLILANGRIAGLTLDWITLSQFFERELNHVCIGLIKGRFAIRQIELPQTQELLMFNKLYLIYIMGLLELLWK